MGDPRGWLSLQSAALRFAEDCLQVREEGDNRGEMVEAFQREAEINPGAPWCAAFVNWCAKQAASVKGVHSPLEDVPLEGYVQSYVEYGRDQGWIVEEPEAIGDLFCLWYPWLNDGEGRYGHIGFVYEVGSPTFRTIEGNTNKDGSREGDGVYVRSRSRQARKLVFLHWGD